MEFNQYQELAKSTAIYPNAVSRVYPFLGLLGEVGESIEKLNKDNDELSNRDPKTAFDAMSIFQEAIALGRRAETLKKVLRKEGWGNKAWDSSVPNNLSEEFLTELKKELGDVLWYLSATASDFGLSLDEIAESNYKKLKDRQDRNVLHGNGDNR